MKILFPIGSFYPAQRGPANTVYWLVKALKKNKISTTVITTGNHIKDNNLIFNRFIENEAGSVIYNKEKSYKFPYKMLVETVKEIKKNDIVHLSSLFFPPALIFAFFARFYGKKVVWSVRGELEDGAMHYKSKFKMFYIKLVKLCITKNFVFHGTSAKEVTNIKKYFPNVKTVKLPNYIELPKKVDILVEKQILFLGRIAPIKALENLIEGASKSKEFNSSDFTIKIVGPIDSQNYLDKLKNIVTDLNLTDKVIFLPMVAGIEKQRLLAQSYFLVLPSHSENFGNVVLEACSQGTPIIASFGTPWESLEENKAGYWVDNSVKELSKVLDKVVTLDSSTYTQMRINSYEFVKKRFSIDKNINKFIEVYRNLLSK